MRPECRRLGPRSYPGARRCQRSQPICLCLLALLGSQRSLEDQRQTTSATAREQAALAATIANHRARLAILRDPDGSVERLEEGGFLSPLDHGMAVETMERLVHRHGLSDLTYRFKGEKQVMVQTDIGPRRAWRDEIVLNLKADSEPRLTAFLGDLDGQIPGRLHPLDVSLNWQGNLYTAQAVLVWTAAAADDAAITANMAAAFIPAEAEGPAWPPLIATQRALASPAVEAGTPARPPAAPLPPIHLDGLIFSGPGNWIAWINGQAVRPGQQPLPYRIERVAKNAVFVRPPGGGETIRLLPGQGFAGQQTSNADCNNDSTTRGTATPCA